jgi:hypothetical protein
VPAAAAIAALFHGPVRVPEEAGSGMAKVAFSFGAWEGGQVAPSTVELPVMEPAPGKKGGAK